MHCGWSFFWGTFKGVPILSDFEASAYVIGPSGSGKSTKIIQTNAMALRGFDKVLLDFKSDLGPILKKPLEARGEDVKIISLGDLFETLLVAVMNIM